MKSKSRDISPSSMFFVVMSKFSIEMSTYGVTHETTIKLEQSQMVH